MKLLFIVLLFTIQIYSQWIPSNLGGAQYGYNLYTTDTEVFAATLNGVYSIEDTSNTWISLGMNNRLVFDIITSNQYILAATENTGPGVYRSSDHGNTWTETSGMSNLSVRAFTKNSSYIFACTWGGGVFRSDDNGATWQSLGLTNNGFRSIYAVGEKIFVGGYQIYFSTDNGDTWDSRQLPYPAGDTWCFYYDNGILYAGDMGLYSSTDLGNTWQLSYGVTFDSTGTATDAKIFKDIVSYNNTLIASVSFNSILISYDGGNSWSSFNDGLFPDWTFSGLAIKDPYIWALRSDFGNAYYRPLTNVTAVEDINTTLPNDYRLFQNYPNPFNPTTTIEFTIPKPELVSLKIYNLLGQEVFTLVSENLKAGNYKYTWDARVVASGVYIYKLQSGAYQQVRKMVYLK